MSDKIQETKLIVHIENKNAIELNDLSQSMCALSDQYQKFVEKTNYSKESRDAKLYVTQVRDGSIIIELQDFLYVAAIPFIGEFNSIIEFAKHLKFMIDLFFKNRTIGEVEGGGEISVSDCNDIAALVNPISKENSSQMIITTVINGNIVNNFNVGSRESKIIKKNTKTIQEDLQEIKTDNTLIERAVLTLYQARNMQNSKVGNKGIIETISDKPINITFASDEIQEEMLSAEINPLTAMYEVDVKPQTVRGELKGYQIVKIHQYFDDYKST